MTAVAAHPAQQHQHQPSILTAPASSQQALQQQSRKSSISAASSASSRVARDGPTSAAVVANGTSPAMLSHPASNGVQQTTAMPPPLLQRPASAMVNGNGHGHTNGVSPDHDRPTSAPGNKQHRQLSRGASFDDSDRDQPTLRPKPPLLRSKSEHHMMHYDDPDHEVYDWSARHGFEDHYQSEDIISHLANVSDRPLRVPWSRFRSCDGMGISR
jgi:regulatory associated protein of mTOR